MYIYTHIHTYIHIHTYRRTESGIVLLAMRGPALKEVEGFALSRPELIQGLPNVVALSDALLV